MIRMVVRKEEGKRKINIQVLFVKSSIVKVRGAKCLNHNSKNVIMKTWILQMYFQYF